MGPERVVPADLDRASERRATSFVALTRNPCVVHLDAEEDMLCAITDVDADRAAHPITAHSVTVAVVLVAADVHPHRVRARTEV